MDNRSYDYHANPGKKRLEYDLISQWIPKKSKVIDLGCGDGSLLSLLKTENQCEVFGVELSPSGVEICHKRGLNQVIQGTIDKDLPFDNQEFDFSICNVTLQMVMYPEKTLQEMKRISQKQIVSFPNFAYFINRWQLLIGGKMPTKMLSGYQWYNTGHIHQLSLKDYLEFVKNHHLKVEKITGKPSFPIPLLESFFPNCFTKVAIVLTSN